MDILFILPKKPGNVIHFSDMPPLGLLTLATLSKKENITLIDENKENINYKNRPDLVCISICTPTAPRGYAIAEHFRKKQIPVMMGGMHASALPDEALEHCNSVVIGEAEEIWKNILNDFRKNKLKRKYRQDKLTSLSNVPKIDFSILRKRYLLNNLIQTTRGCNHNCDFCSVTRFYGHSIRHRPVDDVIQEIKQMKARSKGIFKDWFFIIDDNIISDKKYAETLLRSLIPLKIKIIAQSSISIADDKKLLTLAKRAGVKLLYIGFESLDQSFLNNMKKPNKSMRYKESISKIKRYGIAIVGSFILTDKHLKSKVLQDTLRFCENLELAEFQPLQLLPGTTLYSKKKHMVKDFSWAHIRNTNSKDGRSSPRINPELLYCYRRFYSVSRILKRTVKIRKQLKTSIKSTFAYLSLNIYLCLKLRFSTD